MSSVFFGENEFVVEILQKQTIRVIDGSILVNPPWLVLDKTVSESSLPKLVGKESEGSEEEYRRHQIFLYLYSQVISPPLS